MNGQVRYPAAVPVICTVSIFTNANRILDAAAFPSAKRGGSNPYPCARTPMPNGAAKETAIAQSFRYPLECHPQCVGFPTFQKPIMRTPDKFKCLINLAGIHSHHNLSRRTMTGCAHECHERSQCAEFEPSIMAAAVLGLPGWSEHAMLLIIADFLHPKTDIASQINGAPMG